VEMEQAIDALAAQTKDMNTLQNQHHMLQVHWLQMVQKVPECASGANYVSYAYTHCLRLACMNLASVVCSQTQQQSGHNVSPVCLPSGSATEAYS